MLWNLGQRWLQAMNMHSFITHIAYNYLVFISVLLTFLACFAIWAFPLESFHKLRVKRRLVAVTVKLLTTLHTLHRFLFFIGQNLLNTDDTCIQWYRNLLFLGFGIFHLWRRTLLGRLIFCSFSYHWGLCQWLQRNFRLSLVHWISYIPCYFLVFRSWIYQPWNVTLIAFCAKNYSFSFIILFVIDWLMSECMLITFHP